MTQIIQTLAIIYVTSAHVDRHTERCAEYINRLGYRLAAVIVDELGGGRWPEAAAMLMDGTAQVLVVADRDELPTERTPRVDVVSEERRRRMVPDQRCRPRMLR